MGQWPDSILFQSNAQGATIWFTSTGILCQFARRVSQIDRVEVDNKITRAGSLGRELEHDSIEVLMSKATFVGANYNIKVIPEGMLKQKYNYILGKNPSDWRTNVPSYAAITLRGIYPGVDVRYTGDNAGQIVYKFVTAPEADLSQIKVAYENAATLRPTIRST